jgi:hypothetical protein
MSEEIAVKKRAAAIKLAKELKPYDMGLGDEFLPVYMETLTEDMKQVSRDNRRLAKEIDLIARARQEELFAMEIDGEKEVISKLLRRGCTRITKGCDLLYNATYIDFEQHEEDEIDRILEEGEEDDSDD